MTRESLLNAGVTVVASEGYAAASIAKIADLAGVAHGTFYNYFEDRQALFDELLPYEGIRMREAIETVARGVPPGLQRELVRFDAFLSYVIENEGFYRVLYEAEIFAPVAHRAHMRNIIDGYKRTFARAMDEKRMSPMSPQHVECLIYQMLGIRAYAAMQIHFARGIREKQMIRKAAGETYRILIGSSLLEDAADDRLQRKPSFQASRMLQSRAG